MRAKIGILQKGDKVLSAGDGLIVVQRKNGEVDLIPIVREENSLPRIDMENIVSIGYGDNSIDFIGEDDDGNEVKFSTF